MDCDNKNKVEDMVNALTPNVDLPTFTNEDEEIAYYEELYENQWDVYANDWEGYPKQT